MIRTDCSFTHWAYPTHDYHLLVYTFSVQPAEEAIFHLISSNLKFISLHQLAANFIILLFQDSECAVF